MLVASVGVMEFGLFLGLKFYKQLNQETVHYQDTTSELCIPLTVEDLDIPDLEIMGFLASNIHSLDIPRLKRV